MFDSGLFSPFCSLPAALQTFRVACCSLLGAAGGGFFFFGTVSRFFSPFFMFCFSLIDFPSHVGHARARQRRASRARSSHQTRPSLHGRCCSAPLLIVNNGVNSASPGFHTSNSLLRGATSTKDACVAALTPVTHAETH